MSSTYGGESTQLPMYLRPFIVVVTPFITGKGPILQNLVGFGKSEESKSGASINIKLYVILYHAVSFDHFEVPIGSHEMCCFLQQHGKTN